MVPSTAGAMFSTHAMHAHTLPSPDAATSQHHSQMRRKTSSPTTSFPGQEPEKKPKKVNSELRKQQNRIASRNYREKRKRKLQYLQQLIRDGGSSSPAEKQTGKAVAGGDQRQRQSHSHSQQRTLSPNVYSQQDPPRPNTSNTTTSSSSRNTTILPSNHFTQTFPPTSSNPSSLSAPTTTSYPQNPSYTPFEPQPSPWTTTPSIYDIPPPLDLPPWNNLHSTPWIPNIDFSPPMTTRSADDFQFTPPPPAPPQLAFPPIAGTTGFEQQQHHQHQLPTPPRQAHTPEPDFYFASGGAGASGSVYAECGRRLPLDVHGSSISLPSSPFCHPR
ncbi:hypothetical protein DM02DRAFT_660470 [Periconia macrospinosa]|uniref:BZIP domain-containing protein n=1 Tax=Periconia macrospinosa TaxID=97972 RepID=A0A2V1DD59_9PLEO|nr:hypothetical protein DM02DRAFT_660470 [Periconia macrospinosa]